MNIKHLFFLCIILLLGGCKTEEKSYTGKNYIEFSTLNHTFGVLNNEEWFEIPIVASYPVDSKLNIGVEVIAAESSAIEGLHFELESHTVAINADKKNAAIRIKGLAENLAINNTYEIVLSLILNEENSISGKSPRTKVTLQRCYPFDINNFAGYAVLTSTWSMQYMNTDSTLVRTHIDENSDNTVVIEDMFYEGYDIRVQLDSTNRLEPLATLCGPQVLGSTGEAFGTIYGNGKLMIGYAPEGYISYYSTYENFLLLYSEIYVEEVGTVGYFGHILEWISDDEAERIMREGF